MDALADLDLSAAETVQDPYPAYAVLREHAPVYRWETDDHPRGGMWIVTRYDAVRAMMADDRLTKRGENVGLPPEFPPIMMFLDPPEHTRLRKPATQTFTKRRVEALRDGIEREVAELIEPLLDGESFDIVAQLARPMPLHTIVRLLGFPMEDAAYLHDLSNAILDVGDMAAQTSAIRAGTSAADYDAEVRRTDDEAEAYVRRFVENKIAEPGDDLTSALLAAAPDSGMTPDEVAAMSMQLLVNGHLSTVNVVGTTLLHLLRNRDQWEALVTNPDLVPGAVEEGLRYEAPTQRSSGRYTLEEIEVEGVTIPAGEQVSAVMGSANRDERVFAEADRFDVTRSPNPHLSFGHGRHHCPGAAMTRLELSVVLRALATTAPDLGLLEDRPAYRPNSIDRGLVSLRVQRAA